MSSTTQEPWMISKDNNPDETTFCPNVYRSQFNILECDDIQNESDASHYMQVDFEFYGIPYEREVTMRCPMGILGTTVRADFVLFGCIPVEVKWWKDISPGQRIAQGIGQSIMQLAATQSDRGRAPFGILVMPPWSFQKPDAVLTTTSIEQWSVPVASGVYTSGVADLPEVLDWLLHDMEGEVLPGQNEFHERLAAGGITITPADLGFDGEAA